MTADTVPEEEELSPLRRFILFFLTALFVFMLINLLTRDRPTVVAHRFDPAEAERQRKRYQKAADAHLRKVILDALREHDRRG